MAQPGEYLSLLFGAAIIIHFAYNRFHEADFGTQAELARMHELLSVDRMRTQSVVRLSLVSYTAALLTIYLLLTVYVLIVPAGFSQLPQAGEVVGGQIPGAQELAKGLGAAPLGVALVIVGTGTSFPYVRNVEAWLRNACHRLAGIPTKVLDHARNLGNATLDVDEAMRLLSQSDAECINAIRAAHPADEEFLRDLTVIAAVAEWVLRRKVSLPDPPARRQFLKLEAALLDRKIALFRKLRAMPTAQPAAAGATPAAASAWSGLTVEADLLEADMCLLLALFREHMIIPPGAVAGSSSQKELPSSGSQARAILEGFVSGGESGTDRGGLSAHVAMLALSWSFGVIVIVCILWTALPAFHELRITFPSSAGAGRTGVLERFAAFLSNAIFAYFVPVAIAVAIWQGSTAADSWKAGLSDHWTRSLPRKLLLFASGWVVATFLLCGIAVWTAALRGGWTSGGHSALSLLLQTASYVGPTAMRGAFLGVLVVECIDHYWQGWYPATGRTGAPERRSSLRLAAVAALILGTAGALTRWLVIEISIAGNSTSAARRSIDAYDRGVIAYAAILSAVTAFVLIYCLSEALRKSRAAPQAPSEEAPRESAQPASAEADDSAGSAKAGLPTAKGVTLAIALLLGCLSLPGEAQGERLVIGVRTDARPYVWQDSATGAYLGYLLDVCTSMAQRAGFDFATAPVDARQRAAFLVGDDAAIDLLCDPTTITLARVQTMLRPPIEGRLTFLPIFHIANSSYLARARGATEKIDCPQGGPEAPTAVDKRPWIRFWLPDRPVVEAEMGVASGQVWGAIKGTTSADRLAADHKALDAKMRNSTCLAEADSHPEAAAKLCSGEWQRYYGDEELIAAAVAAHDPACRPTRAPETARQYEPYALVVSTARHCGLDRILAAQLYGMAADGSLEGKLKQHFPEASISASLRTLLNTLKLPQGAVASTPPPSLPPRLCPCAQTCSGPSP